MDSGGRVPAPTSAERADDRADHVAQEPVAVDLDDDLAAGLSDVDPLHGPHRVADRRAARLERREVVAADEAAAARRIASMSRGPGACQTKQRSNGDSTGVVAIR